MCKVNAKFSKYTKITQRSLLSLAIAALLPITQPVEALVTSCAVPDANEWSPNLKVTTVGYATPPTKKGYTDAQRTALTRRASRLDATRSLVEQIDGMSISGNRQNLSSYIDSTAQAFHVVGVKELENGVIETTMESLVHTTTPTVAYSACEPEPYQGGPVYRKSINRYSKMRSMLSTPEVAVVPVAPEFNREIIYSVRSNQESAPMILDAELNKSSDTQRVLASVLAGVVEPDRWDMANIINQAVALGVTPAEAAAAASKVKEGCKECDKLNAILAQQ